MNSKAIAQIKRAPRLHADRPIGPGAEHLFKGWPFRFPIDDRVRAFQLGVVETASREDTALRQLRPRRHNRADSDPRIETISRMPERPSADRDPEPTETSGADCDPNMIDPKRIVVGLDLEIGWFTGGDDKFVGTKSEVDARSWPRFWFAHRDARGWRTSRARASRLLALKNDSADDQCDARNKGGGQKDD